MSSSVPRSPPSVPPPSSFRRPTFRGVVAHTSLLLALLVLAGESSAQTIRGGVVDADDGSPVVGAVVVALEVDGRERPRALTDVRGDFVLHLDSDTEVEAFRVERIGYASQRFQRSDLASADEPVLRVATEPVALDGIDVETASRCGAEMRGGSGVYEAWSEARKSLEVTELSRSSRIARFQTQRMVQSLDPHDLSVLERSVERRRFWGRHPYRSIPIERVVESGWVERDEEGGIVYHAPDAAVLVSNEFVEQHCFTAERTDEGVVLRFVPNRARRHVPEIEGEMILDPVTSELTELRFRYVRIPLPPPADRRAGGEIHFVAAPNGLRVVREWSIRMPMVTLERIRIQGRTTERVRVRSLREEGGRVTRVRVGDRELDLEGPAGSTTTDTPTQREP